MNSYCSNLLYLRNPQEQVIKAFCYQKLFWPFTVPTNCSSHLKNIFSITRTISYHSWSGQILLTKYHFSLKVRIILETKYHYSSNGCLSGGPPCFIQSFLAKSWHFDRKGPMVKSGPDRVEKFLALDQEDIWRKLSFSQNWTRISLSNFKVCFKTCS